MADPQLVSWGTVKFYADRWLAPTNLQVMPAVRAGLETSRESQPGVQKVKLGDYSGGLYSGAGIQSWLQKLNQPYINQGLQTRNPGLAILPPAITNQTSITSDENISGFNAANKRAHAWLSSQGSTGLRQYIGLGKKVLRDISLTNSALEVGDTMTNNITAAGQLMFGSTLYDAVATDGATDGIKGTTNPTGATAFSGGTSLVALNAGDYIAAFAYMPQIGPGINVFVGRYLGTDGVWWAKASAAAPATLQVAVLTSTRDLPNTLNAAVGTGAKNPGTGLSVITNATQTAANIWSTPGNVTAFSDLAYATLPAATGVVTTNGQYLYASGYDLSALPDNSTPVGLQVSVRRSVVATAVVKDDFLQLAYGLTGDAVPQTLTIVGQNKADRVTAWPTAGADATVTYGSSTDLWATNLSVATLKRPDFGVILAATQTNVAASNARVDGIQMQVWYKPQGVSPAFALGGYGIGAMPDAPDTLPIVMPVTNDQAAYTVPRKLWTVRFSWYGSGQVVTCDLTKPDQQMATVHAAAHFLGGIIFTGGQINGPGRLVRHWDGATTVRSYGFSGLHGTTEVRVNSLQTQDIWAILDVVNADFTDRQHWFWNNAKYYPDNLLQSKSNQAITTQPLVWAESTPNLQQSRMYSIFPIGTRTGVARQYLAADLSQDPRLISPTEVKSMAFTGATEDTPLYLQLPELDMGPEESNKLVTVAQCQTRRVSLQAGTYGRVFWQAVRDPASAFGAENLASGIAQGIFTAFMGTYQPIGGLWYQSISQRVGLDHTAGSANSPDGAPIVLTTVQQWAGLDIIDVWVTPDQTYAQGATYISEPAMIAGIYALANAGSPAQTLKLGDLIVLCVFEQKISYIRGISPTKGQAVPLPGQPVSAADVFDATILRFRKVPGVAA